MTAAMSGRATARDSMRPRTLVCTTDGIWLWPGTALTERRGAALVPIPTPQLYQQVAMLHGPAVHAAALARGIERAAACLSQGRLQDADALLATLPLPPVSFDGGALMQAISRRLGVSAPDVEIAGWPSDSPPELFEQLARVHDRKLAIALTLEPVFNPDLQRVAPANAPFDPLRHPRWPAGQPDGGQFRPNDGGGAVLPVGGRAEAVRRILEGLARLWRSLRRLPKPSEPSEPASSPPSEPLPEDAAQEPPPRATPGAEEEKPPGIGHNGPPIETVPDVEPPKPAPPVPPSDWPFEMPVEAPADSKDISLYGRRVSNAIREALKNNDEKTLKEIGDAVSKAPWLSDQIDNILADQDQPRDLDELIERAKPGARPGYNLHHIVEQGPQNKDIPDAQIEAPDNIALVPTYKHWQITAYYRRGKNPEFGGLSPREGLKGKTFQEKYDFGIKVLKVFGVLK